MFKPEELVDKNLELLVYFAFISRCRVVLSGHSDQDLESTSKDKAIVEQESHLWESSRVQFKECWISQVDWMVFHKLRSIERFVLVCLYVFEVEGRVSTEEFMIWATTSFQLIDTL